MEFFSEGKNGRLFFLLLSGTETEEALSHFFHSNFTSQGCNKFTKRNIDTFHWFQKEKQALPYNL